MFASSTKPKSYLGRLAASVAAASLLTATLATPAAAQDPYVITADELAIEEDRLAARQYRQANRLRGGEYILTPDGDYVLIEDRRFRDGLRAGHRGRGDGFHGRQPHYHTGQPVRIEPPRRNNNQAVIAAGIVGLAAGAIIANELGKNRQRQHGVHVSRPPSFEPPIPVRRVERVPLSQLRAQQTQVSHTGSTNGWIGSSEWLRYCTAKYRSFNPSTGRFLSYSGQYKLCR
ncbi:MAG: BA14K family protein [Pseudomonadota bacterium]